MIAVAAVAAAAAGARAAQPPSSKAAVEAGRAFTARACAGCHAIGRFGSSPNPHAPPFRLLAERLPGAALEAQLAAISRYGHVEMPPIYMTEAEVRGAAAYIRSVRPARRT